MSRWKLTTEVERKILKLFSSELAKLTDKSKFDSLLSLLLSPNEKIMLAKRLAAFVMLEKETPNSDIAKGLHLTRVTITKLKLSYLLAKERKQTVVNLIKSLTNRVY